MELNYTDNVFNETLKFVILAGYGKSVAIGCNSNSHMEYIAASSKLISNTFKKTIGSSYMTATNTFTVVFM